VFLAVRCTVVVGVLAFLDLSGDSEATFATRNQSAEGEISTRSPSTRFSAKNRLDLIEQFLADDRWMVALQDLTSPWKLAGIENTFQDSIDLSLNDRLS